MSLPGDSAHVRQPSPTGAGLTTRRQFSGFALAVIGLPGLTFVMLSLRSSVTLGSILLLYLLTVVVVAVVGGLRPAVTTAIAAFLLANFFFTPPYRTLLVENRDAAVALVVFVVVAVLVAVTVDVSARRQIAAARSEAEAKLLSQKAQRLTEVDRARAALLAAVGHDLRTPLAGIKAAVSSLRQSDITWQPEDEQALLETIESGADRLDDLIGNLLAMSRLQAGVLSVSLQPVALDEVVGRALLDRPEAGHPGAAPTTAATTRTAAAMQRPPSVVLDIDEDTPRVLADPGLLERVVANLITNACRFSPPDTVVTVRAESVASAGQGDAAAVPGSEAGGNGDADTDSGAVRVLVVDHGSGVPRSSWEEMFVPFQRLDDQHTSGGVGLGLAIARGFTEAMGGTVTPEETPGGGLTMVVTLPVALS